MIKLSSIKEFWIHIIFWICLFSFPVSIYYLEYGELKGDMFIRLLAAPILVYLNYLFLVPELLLNKKIGIYIVVSILVLILFNIIINFFTPLTPPPPFKKVEQLLTTEEFTKFMKIPHAMTAVTSLAFFLLGGVVGLGKDFYRRDKVNQKIKVEQKETELQFLKAQLNPHFLFNSLNSIYSLVRNGSNEASEAVITLSELMRYMLYEAQESKVNLKKEIDYIKNYVQLQLYRLSNSEDVRLKISGEYADKKIAPLLLIPFVENAFKYGTDFKGKTHVDIKIRIIDDSLFFEVVNGIGSYRKDEASSGIGLTNIKNRLQLLYSNEHVLKIDKDDVDYHVQLELNLLT